MKKKKMGRKIDKISVCEIGYKIFDGLKNMLPGVELKRVDTKSSSSIKKSTKDSMCLTVCNPLDKNANVCASVGKITKTMGVISIAIVTLPLKTEGKQKIEKAKSVLKNAEKAHTTVIAISKDKLLELVPKMPGNAALRFVEEILIRSVRSITEMMTKPGLINVDYADLETIMKNGGVAMIGLGEGDGKDRAQKAVQQALTSPLLDADITNASGALINVFGGPDMTISDAQQAVGELHKKINPESTIIWGASIDPALEHTVRVMVVVTGVSSEQIFGKVGGGGKKKAKAKVKKKTVKKTKRR